MTTNADITQHVSLKADAVLPRGDVVWQWDCDSGPRRAVDWTVDGGLVELEGGAAHIVDRRRETLRLDQLPRVGPDWKQEEKCKQRAKRV